MKKVNVIVLLIVMCFMGVSCGSPNYYPNVSKRSPFEKKLRGAEKNCQGAFYSNRYKRANR